MLTHGRTDGRTLDPRNGIISEIALKIAPWGTVSHLTVGGKLVFPHTVLLQLHTLDRSNGIDTV